jgi:hypothetical protein
VAQADPGWLDLLPHDRARVLQRIADGTGGPRPDLLDPDLRYRQDADPDGGTFRCTAAVCQTLEEELPTRRGSHLTMSTWHPMDGGFTWLPRSECTMVATGRRRATAWRKAETARSAVIRASIE